MKHYSGEFLGCRFCYKPPLGAPRPSPPEQKDAALWLAVKPCWLPRPTEFGLINASRAFHVGQREFLSSIFRPYYL